MAKQKDVSIKIRKCDKRQWCGINMGIIEANTYQVIMHGTIVLSGYNWEETRSFVLDNMHSLDSVCFGQVIYNKQAFEKMS